MAGFRVLVCGGRSFECARSVLGALNDIYREEGVAAVIEGGAKGADCDAGLWADALDIEHLRFSAQWDKHGKAAGPIRNRQMLDEGKPDLVLAFPGGKGTANMVKLAREAGLEVREIQPLTPRS